MDEVHVLYVFIRIYKTLIISTKLCHINVVNVKKNPCENGRVLSFKTNTSLVGWLRVNVNVLPHPQMSGPALLSRD
jgi:hypothetical protein